MNIFDELANLYFEIDSKYAILELQSRSKGHFIKEKSYKRKRELNDQAHFLFMFTRLEDRITKLSIELIDERNSNLTTWNYRRTWEILMPRREKGIHFMDRVGLLTPLAQADYNLIKVYYGQRNSIAHGKSFTIPISIATVVVDMKRLYDSLSK